MINFFSDRDMILDKSPELAERFHLIINDIELLIRDNKITADVDKIYALIERISNRRSVSSAFYFVSYPEIDSNLLSGCISH
jgi:hypothetical protein